MSIKGGCHKPPDYADMAYEHKSTYGIILDGDSCLHKKVYIMFIRPLYKINVIILSMSSSNLSILSTKA